MRTVFTNHITKIDAPSSVVWDLLLDKVRRPDKYVPGVVEVEVPQEFSDKQIERKMKTEDGNVVHEFITADELTKTVVFKTANNPKTRGFVSNTLYEEDGEVWLDYTLNWVLKDDAMPDMTEQMTNMIKGAVEHTKQLAEERAGK